MRISDWSSDVCSSDLWHAGPCPLQMRLGNRRSCWQARKRSAPDRDASRPALHPDMPQPTQASRTDAAATSASNGPGALSTGIVATSACGRSEEHTSELQSLMRISYAVFCLKTKKKNT